MKNYGVDHHNERHDERSGITLYRERINEHAPFVYWITKGDGNPETDDWWSTELGIDRSTLRRRCQQIFGDNGCLRNLLAKKKYMPARGYKKRSSNIGKTSDMVSRSWRLALSLGRTRYGLEPMLPVELEMPTVFNSGQNQY